MKRINLNGTAISSEEAIKVIADLQAQIDAPEPVALWPGQLVEVRDTPGNPWAVRTFSSYDGTRDKPYLTQPYNMIWAECRPLSDPLIDQYAPLAKGESLPTTYGDYVWIRFEDGSKTRVGVDAFNKYCYGYRFAIGWMPADGWAAYHG